MGECVGILEDEDEDLEVVDNGGCQVCHTLELGGELEAVDETKAVADRSDTIATGVAKGVKVRVALDERGDGRGPTMLVCFYETEKDVDIEPDFLRDENHRISVGPELPGSFGFRRRRR